MGDQLAAVRVLRYRRALSRAAVAAVAADWPVLPGAWWSARRGRFVCEVPGCKRTGPHPVLDPVADGGIGPLGEGLAARALRHPDAVLARWRRQPYSILLPTGVTCDAVDVPAALGRRVADRLGSSALLGPAVLAGGRWLLLTAAGNDPGSGQPALPPDVILHGRGSWITLPPSVGSSGEPLAWLSPPGRGPVRLPYRDDVIGLLGAEARIPMPRSRI